MNDIEWKQFIKELIKTDEQVNLKSECQKKKVGLNTLHRKVSKLEETDIELYKEFVAKFPYQPRDTQGIDFEQLMRESILTGLSQKDLEVKYGVSKRTIQRKFAQIEKNNFTLYQIYQMYVSLKTAEKLNPNVIDEVASEYIPQKVETKTEKLEDRRKKFIESMNQAKDTEQRQLYKHYQEQIKRLDQQKRVLEGEEK